MTSKTASAGASRTQTGIALSANTFILATLQQKRAGVYLAAAVPNPGAGSFTIHLNKAVTKDTTVGWFIIR